MDNIANINGKDAFVGARIPAWHGLGTIVDHAMTAVEAFEKSQQNFEVEKQRLYLKNADGSFRAVDAYGIVRTSDGQMFGTCTKFYKPIQNAKGFELIDALLELANGGAYYETAGALGKGEVVWALAKLPQDIEVVPGDVHKQYLLWSTRHDGNGSAWCKQVATRVVCQNTLACAIGEKGFELRIPHFGKVDEKFEAAKKLMAAATGTALALQEKLRLLARRKLTKETFLAVMDELYPSDPEKAQKGEVEKARLEKLASIAELFAVNDGNAIPQIRGTAYNAFNAITEYVDHYAGTDKARARSAMFGNGDILKRQALEVLLAKTEGAPEHTIVYSKPSTETAVLDRPTVPDGMADYLNATN